MTLVDKMTEDSPAFWKLNENEREQFLEKISDDFELTRSRLEKKGLDTEKPIDKVKVMKEKRIKRSEPF
jgi:hypothetical protein